MLVECLGFKFQWVYDMIMLLKYQSMGVRLGNLFYGHVMLVH
jgi:hypothetical protein